MSGRRLINLEKVSIGEGKTTRLHPTSLTVEQGLTEISGRSGSGKSSLLLAMVALHEPTTGSVTHYKADGETVLFTQAHQEEDSSEAHWLRRGLRTTERALRGLARAIPHETADHEKIARIRSTEFGFITQKPSLLPNLTAEENIRLIHQARGTDVDQEYLDHLVERLGIREVLPKYPTKISGGEQQRIAIAGALAHQPRVLFADEATADLDTANRDAVLELWGERANEGASIIYITHDSEIKEHGIPADKDIARHTIQMENSRLVT